MSQLVTRLYVITARSYRSASSPSSKAPWHILRVGITTPGPMNQGLCGVETGGQAYHEVAAAGLPPRGGRLCDGCRRAYPKGVAFQAQGPRVPAGDLGSHVLGNDELPVSDTTPVQLVESTITWTLRHHDGTAVMIGEAIEDLFGDQFMVTGVERNTMIDECAPVMLGFWPSIDQTAADAGGMPISGFDSVQWRWLANS